MLGIANIKASRNGVHVKLSDEHESFQWANPSEVSKLNLGHFLAPVQAALANKEQFKLPDTPNHNHAKATVLRAARLQSVANWLVKQDVRELDKLGKRLAKAIKEINPTGAGSDTQQQARVAALFKITDADIQKTFDGMAADAMARADQLASILHETNKARLDKHFGVKVGGDGTDASRTLVLGAPLREHYEYLANQFAFKFRTVVRQGVAQGESSNEIAERMDGSAAASPVNASEIVTFHGITKYNCGHASKCRCGHSEQEQSVDYSCPLCEAGIKKPIIATVHAADPSPEQAAAIDKRLSVGVKIFDGTENSLAKVIQAAVTALSNAADAASMEDDEDEDDETRMGFQWNAVLDDATCPTCEWLDGKTWDAEYEPTGENEDEYPGDPAIHFGCRCSVIPVDLDAEKPGEVKTPDGKTKPVSFDDYLSQFSGKEQESAFGKEALNSYRRGDFTANQLIGQKGNLMSLEAFKEAEK